MLLIEDVNLRINNKIFFFKWIMVKMFFEDDFEKIWKKYFSLSNLINEKFLKIYDEIKKIKFKNNNIDYNINDKNNKIDGMWKKQVISVWKNNLINNINK